MERIKDIFSKFFSDKVSYNLRKYGEETWSSYLRRLKDTSEQKGIKEERVLKN